MADRRDSQLSYTTDVVGLVIPVLIPDVISPTSFENAIITITNFQAPLQSQITANTNSLTSLGSRTTILENGLTKVPYTARNAAFQYTQPANSKLVGIYMRRSGVVVPRTAVGYTPYDGGGTNGEEILSSRLHDIDTNYYREIESIPNSYNQTGTRTIYFTPITGIIDVVIYLKTNLFT